MAQKSFLFVLGQVIIDGGNIDQLVDWGKVCVCVGGGG